MADVFFYLKNEESLSDDDGQEEGKVLGKKILLYSKSSKDIKRDFLSLYRKLSQTKHEEIADFFAEVIDRFGSPIAERIKLLEKKGLNDTK